MLKKASSFIVEKRVAILILMLILALAGAICSRFVTINEDLTKYLPDDSRMKVGMDVRNDNFPAIELPNTMRVMIDDLSDAEKAAIPAQLAAIANVESVEYEPVSQEYNRDNHTLYVIHMSCAYGSAGEGELEAALASRFSDRQIVWHNDATSMPTIPVIVYVIVLLILLAILFTMCGSWLEPVLFLAAIGCAVLINLGTNLILGSVSNMTHSIAAILQLVLSMDYSIILMNHYRQEREKEPDKLLAMKQAWVNAFPSVSSSALTTVAGLLMLLFMSFKIGADIGIVMAKGVFLSMVCVLTVLPALILLFDRQLLKTAKKELHIPTRWAARFSFKARYAVAGVFLLLFVGFYFLQTQTGIAYSLVRDDPVADIFPKRNPIVLVYENRDEEQIRALSDRLEADSGVCSVTSYSRTLGKACTAEELAAMFGEMGGSMDLNPALLRLLYYRHYTGGETGRMTAGAFLSFLSDHVLSDESFAAFLDDDMREKASLLRLFADPEALQRQMTAQELAALCAEFADWMDASALDSVFLLYSAQNGGKNTMSAAELVDFILSDPLMQSYLSSISPEQAKTLSAAKGMMDAVIGGQAYSAEEMQKLLGGLSDRLDKPAVEMLYLYKESIEGYDPAWTMTPEALFRELTEQVVNDPRFSPWINAELRMKLQLGQSVLEAGKAQLVSQRYSRMVFTTTYPEESAATTAFLQNLEAELDRIPEGESYLIGNAVMAYEMQQIFDGELLLITLLTAFAIFLIVALTFRSLFVPGLLVLLVQCGVYITVTVTGIMSGSMYYMALLMVECILMGATIDYGILFTNYYREHRRTAGVREALERAYEGSVHTILTSGLILVLITAAVGRLFEDETVTEIIRTLSIGSLSVILLILFILPGTLAACDKLVTRKKDRSETET